MAVGWKASVADGGYPVTSYTVTAYPEVQGHRHEQRSDKPGLPAVGSRHHHHRGRVPPPRPDPDPRLTRFDRRLERSAEVVANITATGGSCGSFLGVYPPGGPVPVTSSVNFGPGETIPNLVCTQIAGDGTIAIYNQLGTVHVIADVLGYYAQT